MYSLVVKAFMSPPTASMASAMSRALRVSVPLNSRCSRKCEAPHSGGDSSREPASTQNDSVAEWESGISSVTTWTPLPRRVHLTVIRSGQSK